MDTQKTRLGIITTGQGPRDEYVTFHTKLLAALGADVEIVSRHALDGADDEALDAIAPTEGAGTPAIHANVKSTAPGARTSLGAGYRDVWIDRSLYFDRVQKAIDDLENEGVAAILLCVAEEVPGNSLHSGVPLVVPAIAMTSLVETVVRTRGNTRVAMFVGHHSEQREQQKITWTRQPWMESATVQYFDIDDGWDAAAEKAARFQPHVGLVWGYGAGLIGGDGGELGRLREIVKIPVFTAHVAATYALRQLLQPQVDPQDYL
jgi:protein AroM